MELRVRIVTPGRSRGNPPHVQTLRLHPYVTFGDLTAILQSSGLLQGGSSSRGSIRAAAPTSPLVFFRASDRTPVGHHHLDFVTHALATPQDVLLVQEVVLEYEETPQRQQQQQQLLPNVLAPWNSGSRRWRFGGSNEKDEDSASLCLKNDDKVLRNLLPRSYGGARHGSSIGPPVDGVFFDSEVSLFYRKDDVNT
jgi:hypothetical protein